MTALRSFVTAGIAFVVLITAAQSRADVVVLFENFNDDINTPSDPMDAAFTKQDADPTDTMFFVRTTMANADRGYWGIYDPDGTTDDFDGATPPAPGTGNAQIPAFTGFTGNFLAGENLDGPGTSHTLPLSLTWSNLNISGLTDITFSGIFAAQTGTWDSADYIRIQYRINSDDPNVLFTNLAEFAGGAGNNLIASGFNESGSLDLSADTAGTFTALIGMTGTTLDLRILMRSDETGEDFAFDSIQITGVPEPGAFLFGGLICGVLGLRAGGRRLFSGRVRRDAA